MAVLTKVHHDLLSDEPTAADDDDFHSYPPAARGVGVLSAITGAENPSLKLWAQVGFLHNAILPTVNGPELHFRRDLEVLRLEVSKAHHTAVESVAVRAVIRVQAINAGLDENPLGQLRLDREKFILEPAARSGVGELLAVILQHNPELLAVKTAVGSKVTEHQFNHQRAIQQTAAIVNGNRYPALDAARAE